MKVLAVAACLVLAPLAKAATLPFELPWMNAEKEGVTYSSAAHSNGIFVVEAYFLNCPYCNENAPNVNDLAESYGSESRVQVLDVGIDRSKAQYEEWIERHHPNHPVLMDAKRELIKKLGTTGYPSTYVIDCHGNVAYKSAGTWSDNKKSAIKGAIDKLLAQECTAD